jgi:hypothetical protein
MTEQTDASPLVHMVGSIPLADAEAVFRTLGGKLGAHMERIPDGETGRRSRWISFINDQMKDHPAFEIDKSIPPFQFTQWDGKVVYEIERLKFKDDVDPATVTFNTGYAEDAVRNFPVFERLQNEGAVPAGVKYQICMATPLAVTYNFMSPVSYVPFIEVYSRHVADEFNKISDALPHDKISYQWDVCQEVLMWEAYYEQPEGYREQVMSVLGNIGNLVPPDIDMGYHLCYGSPRDVHMVKPKDMANLVEIANGIADAVSRPIQYIHMPVPKDRNDEPFFQPLADLRLSEETKLFLGLVNVGDSDNNALKLSLAKKYTNVAGIGSECGLGRGDPEALGPMIAEHLALAETD